MDARSVTRVEPDAETCALLAQRDPDAVRALLAMHEPGVTILLRKEFHPHLDHHDLADVVNQAGLRVWRSSHRFDPSRGTLRAWFFVIARNCARRVLASRRKLPRPQLHADLDSLPDPRPALPDEAPPQVPQPGPLLAAVLACLSELSPQQRAIVQADLAAGGSAPTADLIQSLGTTANSIHVSRAKARKGLLERLQARGLLPGTPRR